MAIIPFLPVLFYFFPFFSFIDFFLFEFYYFIKKDYCLNLFLIDVYSTGLVLFEIFERKLPEFEPHTGITSFFLSFLFFFFSYLFFFFFISLSPNILQEYAFQLSSCQRQWCYHVLREIPLKDLSLLKSLRY